MQEPPPGDGPPPAEDVQDEHYTRPSTDRVEQTVRELYPQLRPMFARCGATEMVALRRQILRDNGLADDADAA